MTKKNLFILSLTILIVFTVLLLAIHSRLSSKPPINIGFIGPLTGKYGDLGVHARNGALLAIGYINSRGGIKGRNLKLIAEDSYGTPQGSIKAFKKLSTLNVKAIIGPLLSTSAISMEPLMKGTNCIPLISPTVSTSRLSGKRDCFFRVMNDNTVEAYGIASYAVKFLDEKTTHPRKWCVIYDLGNSEYTLDFLEHFKKTIHRISDRDYISFQIGYLAEKRGVPEAVFERLDSLSFHALLLITSAIDGAQIINWVSSKKSDIFIFGSTWLASDELLRRLKPGHIPIYVVQQFPSRPTSKISSFADLYAQSYGCPVSYPAFVSYEAVMLLYEALKRSESNKRPLVEIIPAIMDKYGDVHRPCWIELVRQKKLYPVEKVEITFY